MLEDSPHVRQILCIIASSGAGLGQGLFGCLLSWTDREKRRNGGEHTRQSRYLSVCGVVGSTIFGLGSLVGLCFGSVTLVVVMRAGTLLPANVVFSQLFKLRPLVRDDVLGTVMTLTGVICFNFFGMEPPEIDRDRFVSLVVTPASVACNVALALLLVSSCILLRTYFRKRGSAKELGKALMVSNIGSCASAFMDVATKGWSAVLETKPLDHVLVDWLFWSALILNTVFLVVMRVSMIYGCKRCDVLLYVPLNTVLNVLLSVLAGMVVLQEWQQVHSWPGLTCSTICVFAGVVLLASGPGNVPREDVPPTPSETGAESGEGEGPAMGPMDTYNGSFYRFKRLSCCRCCCMGWFLSGCFTAWSQLLARMNHQHIRMQIRRVPRWFRERWRSKPSAGPTQASLIRRASEASDASEAEARLGPRPCPCDLLVPEVVSESDEEEDGDITSSSENSSDDVGDRSDLLLS